MKMCLGVLILAHGIQNKYELLSTDMLMYYIYNIKTLTVLIHLQNEEKTIISYLCHNIRQKGKPTSLCV